MTGFPRARFAGAAIALAVALLVARPARAGTVRPAPPDGLRVATWNIEWLTDRPTRGGENRRRRTEADYERLRAHARALDADIVALQEVDGAAPARRVFDPAVYDFHFTSDGANRQRTGFAWRKGLRVTPQPDVRSLAVRPGGARRGADILVETEGARVRLLSVHLKSGCRDPRAVADSPPCAILRDQIPALEAWIDDRAREGVAFAVLGDFNRSFPIGDVLWRDLDDGDPPGASLVDAGAGRRPRCLGGRYRDFVDHIVLGADAARWLVPGSFADLDYADRNPPSDHCPIAVILRPPRASGNP